MNIVFEIPDQEDKPDLSGTNNNESIDISEFDEETFGEKKKELLKKPKSADGNHRTP